MNSTLLLNQWLFFLVYSTYNVYFHGFTRMFLGFFYYYLFLFPFFFSFLFLPNLWFVCLSFSFLFTFLCRSSVCFHFVIPFSSLPQPFFLVPLPLTLVLTPLRCSLSRCPLPSSRLSWCLRPLLDATHPYPTFLCVLSYTHPPAYLPTHLPCSTYLPTEPNPPPRCSWFLPSILFLPFFICSLFVFS